MESRNQQIQQRALDWLARKDSDTWQPADDKALQQWLDESTAHTVAYIRLETAWKKADKLKVLGAGFPPDQLPAPDRFNLSPVFAERKASKAETRRWPLAVAALVLVATGAGYFAYSQPDTYRTPVGGLTAVPMKDGTRITLNTNSEIKVKITEQERRVALERGEAFFDVAPDPKRPFVVQAGAKQIHVLGTAFSVRRDEDQVRVTVTEGRVRIDDARGELTAGEIATVRPSGTTVQTRPIADAEQSLSWRTGLVMFQDTELSDAVAELNRYNAKQIVIDDPAIASMRFSGKVKPTYFDAFVRLLEGGYPIQASEEDGKIILRSRHAP